MPIEPTISKSQSTISTLNRNKEIFSLTPSTLLTLWEIDASVIMDETGLKDLNYDYIFRFHNSVKLLNTSIYWRYKEYYPLPIQAQGFEYTAKGSPQAPKLTLAINEDLSPGDPRSIALSLLKARLRELDDLAGVKVTRRRVFAKYIDGYNFQSTAPSELPESGWSITGFSPDPNMQFDPDIYYVDRKSLENKSIIEFELGSALDVEGVKLPGRIVNARRCPFQYRGYGCLYEYRANRVPFIHGESIETNELAGSTLPASAPPVANSKDELISNILGVGTKITYLGAYIKGIVYKKGESVYIQKDGIKYYFVAKADNTTIGPPNPIFWEQDVCSKSINGCRLRWADSGTLPFGGMPSCLTVT